MGVTVHHGFAYTGPVPRLTASGLGGVDAGRDLEPEHPDVGAAGVRARRRHEAHQARPVLTYKTVKARNKTVKAIHKTVKANMRQGADKAPIMLTGRDLEPEHPDVGAAGVRARRRHEAHQARAVLRPHDRPLPRRPGGTLRRV